MRISRHQDGAHVRWWSFCGRCGKHRREQQLVCAPALDGLALRAFFTKREKRSLRAASLFFAYKSQKSLPRVGSIKMDGWIWFLVAVVIAIIIFLLIYNATKINPKNPDLATLTNRVNLMWAMLIFWVLLDIFWILYSVFIVSAAQSKIQLNF